MNMAAVCKEKLFSLLTPIETKAAVCKEKLFSLLTRIETKAAVCKEKLFSLLTRIETKAAVYISPSAEAEQETAAESNVQNSEGWGKTIATIAFSTEVAALAINLHSQHPVPSSFYVLCIFNWLAFSFSATSLALRPKYPFTSKVHEVVGILFGVVTFFIILGLILPRNIIFILSTISLLPVLLVSIVSMGNHQSDTMVGDESETTHLEGSVTLMHEIDTV